MNHKLMIPALFVACVGLGAPLSAQAVETPGVQAAAPTIDYSPMELFMKKFAVVERGRPNIAYKAVRKHGEPFLASYTQYLSDQNVSALSSDGQLAYWLNVQNLLVVTAISEAKKTNLKKFRGTGGAPGKLWTKQRITIEGQNLSIADIEHKIVTGWSANPNVLYGIYQGVKGAPCLSKVSYTAENVHGELEKAAQIYVNASGIVKVKSQTAYITPVYDWYQDTLFGQDDKAVIAHIRGHATPNLASKLSRAHQLDVVKLNYKADAYSTKSAPRRQPVNVTTARGTGGYGS